MLKELRTWFQMLDGIEDGTTGTHKIPSGLAADVQAGACGTVAPLRPLTFILDPDTKSAQSLAAMLSASGVDAVMFANGETLAAGLRRSTPELVFVDVTSHGEQAIDTLYRLGQSRFAGGVQLVGPRGSPVVETVRRMGSRHALNMLSPVARPLTPGGIRRILRAQKLSTAGEEAIVNLGEALANDWIEYWYQPKIDLKKRQIAGVEAFARLRHPEMGLLHPADFMAGASDQDIIALTERALVAALKAATNFSQLGIVLRLAVNMPMGGLLNLPIRQMVSEFGPKHHKWPGLLLDVTEAQIDQNLAEVQAVSRGLTACGVHLAIDDIGRGRLALGNLRDLPIAELKLDRDFVADCAVDLERASVCRSVIDLAHHIGCVAVGIGVEKAADLIVLQGMGCDLGQGYLFGQPMPEETLVATMLQRAVAPPPKVQSKPNKPTRPNRTAAATRARWS